MDYGEFSSWIKWNNRDEAVNIKMPGIYAIAISDQSLEKSDFAFLKEIVYFGMTNSKGGLRSRLKAFDNTLKDKTGHGGAARFRYKHIHKEITDNNKLEYGILEKALREKLYVAVAPFIREKNQKPFLSKDLIVMGDVAKAEYECFADYVDQFGCLPEFNDMERSPKK